MDRVTCYCTKARRAARLLTAAYDRALEPVGLKVTQYALLRSIARREAPSITEIAEATGLDRSTLGRNLRVLARAGLVELGAGRDERARSVELTDAGAAAIVGAEPHWARAQAALDARLDEAERALLDRVVAVLETML